MVFRRRRRDSGVYVFQRMLKTLDWRVCWRTVPAGAMASVLHVDSVRLVVGAEQNAAFHAGLPERCTQEWQDDLGRWAWR